jgi:hypothetical protein
LKKARYLARIAGVENKDAERAARSACHIGKLTHVVKVFTTATMQIVVGMDTLELAITKRENDNPVVVSDARGEVFRVHGELDHLQDEIDALVWDW